MPRIILTRAAVRGMERCRRFLSLRNPEAARRAAQAIDSYLKRLEAFPSMGRPFPDLPGARELIIPFGDSGYLALYRQEADDDAIYVLAFRHQREAGY